MEWINIHTSVLEKEVMLDAEPREVCTWLFLQRFCHSQENGGRIEGAKAWDDRKCLRTLHVMRVDLDGKSELWRWEEEDLVLEFYPVEKEREVALKRKGGAKGGRKKWANERARHSSASSSGSSSASSSHEGLPQAELLRKGMEGNGREENGTEATGGLSLSSQEFKKKNPAPRPTGWQDGDADWWWAGELDGVQRALDGALLGSDEKTAARLREVLRARKARTS